MSEVYRETYRGVGFHLTAKGYWFFDDVPPPGKCGHWSRYVKESTLSTPQAMRDAIDRMLADSPVYTGAKVEITEVPK